jgi:hypothetical protein
MDISRALEECRLKGLQLSFESAAEVLENANAVSERAMTGTLHNFLEMNLPGSASSSSKTSAFALGVIDPALATSIGEKVSVIPVVDQTIPSVRDFAWMPDALSDLMTAEAPPRLSSVWAIPRAVRSFNPARSGIIWSFSRLPAG